MPSTLADKAPAAVRPSPPPPARTTDRPVGLGRVAAIAGRVVALALIVFFAVGPILWMVLSSIRPADELFQPDPTLVPSTVTGEWYQEVFRGSEAMRWFANSFVVAVVTTVISLVVGTTAGYAVSRFTFPGRRALLAGLSVAYLFPAILLLVPLYLALNSLGLVGGLPGIVIAHVTITLPLTTWLMKSYVEAVPRELEEAAWVDGLGYLRGFLTVTLPLLRTGLATTAMFSFILSWDEFLFASVIGQGDNVTAPVAMAGFVTSFDIRWGAIMALSTLVTVPVVVLFFVLQRYYEKGLTAGSVKG
ncbi:carbohydrate ABC transporter permease [Phytohabitans sp. ZYX-F-186]|uniref:Carbohydrate ABC transporter permease n=1 Tax=Phytohabitans maris TaxID=3071409 RepID=A0ABU0ZW87_9ACTN|nr:carbohydrate ABC transporter permease [Phytohabitans sp. ZYX-F-186]MDQ7911291.1 carbohydrate ABC transporter permease [Phytohabitans sp. ZYX-F-186]